MKKSVTDKQWEDWANTNPYYGVLGVESTAMGKADVEQAFFASGESHINSVLDLIKRHFGGLTKTAAALDFGCGVGRLVRPLLGRFDRVTGVDISASMIEIAKQRVAQDPRADFVQHLSDLPSERRYDLVHSFIVLQHLRPDQGIPIIESLVDRVAPGGFFALHMTVADLSLSRRTLNAFRYRIAPLHWLYNIVRRRPWNEPITEMNSYDLPKLIHLLRGRYEGALSLRHYEQDGRVGVMIIGKRV